MSSRDPHESLSGALGLALTMRFLLELALLTGAAVAAWRLIGGWVGVVTAIAAVIALAVVWGLLLSPKAHFTVGAVWQLVIEAVLFFGVAAALWAAGLWLPALVGVAVWAADRVAIALLRQLSRQ